MSARPPAVGSCHRDLVTYGEAIALQEGGKPVEPIKLIVPMLQRFIASDRGFARVRRRGT